MLVFVAVVEIKTPDKHVEAAIPVILGRGFNSLRLHLCCFGRHANPLEFFGNPENFSGFFFSRFVLRPLTST